MTDGFRWTINGAAYSKAAPLRAALGSRVEMMFMNPTMMMHPVHLQSHHFRVIDLGQRRFNEPKREVVMVPPVRLSPSPSISTSGARGSCIATTVTTWPAE